jgi:hypothetical protein
MVMHAERAHIGVADASAGSTIFEGDRLSTEVGGVLRITIPAVTLQLGGESSVVLGHAGSEENTFAELTYGVSVFSAAPAGNIVVAANGALVRPAARAATIAHVQIVNRKELRIYAQRGALEFSYHGENVTIREGTNCRAVLDPSGKEVAAAAAASGQTPNRPSRHPPTFILVAIPIAVALGIAIPLIMHASESPDRPGLSPPPPKKP